jgi:hypothetical protein
MAKSKRPRSSVVKRRAGEAAEADPPAPDPPAAIDAVIVEDVVTAPALAAAIEPLVEATPVVEAVALIVETPKPVEPIPAASLPAVPAPAAARLPAPVVAPVEARPAPGLLDGIITLCATPLVVLLGALSLFRGPSPRLRGGAPPPRS